MKNWQTRLCELEDSSVGIYFKMRTHAEQNLGECCFSFGSNEFDMDYIKELAESGFVQFNVVGDTLNIRIGDENCEFFTDDIKPKTGHSAFIEDLRKKCAIASVPYDLNSDIKSMAMCKRIRARKDYQNVVDYTISNWKLLSKVLNIRILNLNILATQSFWDRIVKYMNNPTLKNDLGDRYEKRATDVKFEQHAPVL